MAESRSAGRSRVNALPVALLWLLAVLSFGQKLLFGWPGVSGFDQVILVCYQTALIWHLVRSGQSSAELPAIAPIVPPRISFGEMFWFVVVSIVALLALGGLFHPVLVLYVASAAISLCIIVRWHRRVTLRLILVAFAAALLTGLANAAFPNRDLFSAVFMKFNWMAVFVMFVAGALLLEHTRLGNIRLLGRQYGIGIRGFAWAAILALPLALWNIAGGAVPNDSWMHHWWHPLLAIGAGIGEETWARLFLTTLVYALLRPTTGDRPSRALAAATVIAALTHGLVHISTAQMIGPAGINMILMGLIAGLPMALLFVKRDFEHAVGYHFFVDFVRFGAAVAQL